MRTREGICIIERLTRKGIQVKDYYLKWVNDSGERQQYSKYPEEREKKHLRRFVTCYLEE